MLEYVGEEFKIVTINLFKTDLKIIIQNEQMENLSI